MLVIACLQAACSSEKAQRRRMHCSASWGSGSTLRNIRTVGPKETSHRHCPYSNCMVATLHASTFMPAMLHLTLAQHRPSRIETSAVCQPQYRIVAEDRWAQQQAAMLPTLMFRRTSIRLWFGRTAVCAWPRRQLAISWLSLPGRDSLGPCHETCGSSGNGIILASVSAQACCQHSLHDCLFLRLCGSIRSLCRSGR